MVRHPFGETVERLRATAITDPYSGELTELSWDSPDELAIDYVAVEPRPSSEPLEDARNAVVSGYTLYMEYGSDITSADRVRVRGVVYEVEGEVAPWRNPFTGHTPGLVVQAYRKAG